MAKIHSVHIAGVVFGGRETA
eukprot:COSAG06_NODE_26458_length_614_cov_1.124272_1_plen_20_part_01